jgi:hypothetical protein
LPDLAGIVEPLGVRQVIRHRQLRPDLQLGLPDGASVAALEQILQVLLG